MTKEQLNETLNYILATLEAKRIYGSESELHLRAQNLIISQLDQNAVEMAEEPGVAELTNKPM